VFENPLESASMSPNGPEREDEFPMLRDFLSSKRSSFAESGVQMKPSLEYPEVVLQQQLTLPRLVAQVLAAFRRVLSIFTIFRVSICLRT